MSQELIGTADEWLLHQTDSLIVEDPGPNSFKPIGSDDADLVGNLGLLAQVTRKQTSMILPGRTGRW